MKNDSPTESKLWLDQAADDLKYARVLLREGGYALACFVSQQVAEKALKGFLYSKGEEELKGHSIQSLGKWCERYDRVISAVAEEAKILDAYYIPSRYPNGLPAGSGPPYQVFGKKQAEEAVKVAAKVLRTCRDRAG